MGCISTKSSKRLKDIAEVLGDSMLGFPIIESPCLPVGNAAVKIKTTDFMFKSKIPPQQCLNLNTLAIMTNGLAYPCCSQAGNSPALCLGSAKELPLTEIVKNFYGNMYCRILEKYGVKWLFNIIEKNGLDFKLRNNYVSICDACYDLLHDKDNLINYLPFLEEEERKIYEEYKSRLVVGAGNA